MSEIDRVFGRMGGSTTAGTDVHERRTIARRGSTTTARVVEVVRLAAREPGAAPTPQPRPDPRLRAESWEGGFPIRQAPQRRPAPVPAKPTEAQPVGHVIQRWQSPPADIAAEPEAPAPRKAMPAPRQRRVAAPAPRPVADPFDPEDDRANCLRCGYAVEARREARGLMTCAACG
jgi:hypothetical protein